MNWAGVLVIVVVLVAGTIGGLLRRRLDGRLRDVSAARRRLAELTGDAAAHRPSPPETAATAAAAASHATAAVVGPSDSRRPPARTLRLVRETGGSGEQRGAPTAVPPDAREEPGVVVSGVGEEPGVVVSGVGEEPGVVLPDAREEPGVVERPATDDDRLDAGLLERLGVGPAAATLVQFSSAFCAPCRAVRRISSEVADLLPGVRHVEIDAESHLTEVRELGIWRTPTLLLLDADGRVVKRATGVPSKPQLIAALAEILPPASE